MIHIRRDHKIILILYQLQESVIHRLWRIHVPVDVNIAAPVRPVFLQRVIRIKAPGIHIVEIIFFLKIRKVLFESFSTVYKAR